MLFALGMTLGTVGATSVGAAQTSQSAQSAQSAPIASTAPADPWCRSKPEPAFCHAVRGVRAEGWPAQSRSEVMAQNGMVVTSQPLAAQAGLQVLMRGPHGAVH
jgi:gamma-glutamyltranspeptidase/glutathione hydrolase